MKKIFILFLFFLWWGTSFARIRVLCDVVYEKSIGEWSTFYRTEVEFLRGSEMNLINSSNKLYAVIWFSQTNCAIIEMEYFGVLLSDIDKNSIFTYLGFDILNEGKLGTQINDDKKRRWRIYGKDENSFLIDPMFNDYPYNSYNNGVEENSQNGIVVSRQRPQGETQIGD